MKRRSVAWRYRRVRGSRDGRNATSSTTGCRFVVLVVEEGLLEDRPSFWWTDRRPRGPTVVLVVEEGLLEARHETR
jgi:hypothetical protein